MLETKRLTLAPFSQSDVSDLFWVRGDTRSMLFWDWPADASVEQTHVAAAMMLADAARADALYWAARLKDGGAFVGLFDLSDLRSEDADLGFMIGHDFQGRGYAFEAASRVVDEARRRGFSKLKARIHVGNVRSGRLLDRLGFSLLSEAEVEIRPGVMQRCLFYGLAL